MSNKHKFMDRLKVIHGNVCHYCKCQVSYNHGDKPNSATVEHLIHAGISKDLKKENKIDKCVIACRKCNEDKNKEFVKHNPLTILELNIVGVRKSLVRAQSEENWEKAAHIENSLLGLMAKWDKLIAAGFTN